MVKLGVKDLQCHSADSGDISHMFASLITYIGFVEH